MFWKSLAASMAALAVSNAPALAQPAQTAPLKTVVLVHGAWADGSGWKEVYNRLTRDGYQVLVVQNPTTSFDTDVAFTNSAIDSAAGDVVLVGHSYGGAVITQAGNNPKVKALVYIAAYAPDKGESVYQLGSTPVPGATPPPVLPPKDGYLFLDPAKFPEAFAQDVPLAEAKFLAASQVPWAIAAASGTITDPAWRTRPAWSLITTQDHMIPPSAQEMMASRAHAHKTEVAASHAVFLSKPDVVTAIIEQAAHNAVK